MKKTSGSHKRNSSSVVWTFKGELFDFDEHVFNVDLAKQLVKNRPRPIRALSLQPFVDEVGPFGIYINYEKALSTRANLKDPILVAYIGELRMIIDGWHRVFKAKALRRKTLPAVLLTREESKRIKLGP